MSVINTTNVIDNSIFLKAELPENMVSDNYYIENLQDRRNLDWDYRYNKVLIEEELQKQSTYSNQAPNYTPIDVVITNVKGEKGEDLGIDWASLSFRDLKHSNNVGDRYRFSLDFPDMSKMTEEEKHYNTSVWIAINKAPIHPGNSCMVRRCNTFLTLLGYENRDRRKKTTREKHCEPVILENEMKYMQVYYNQVAPVPQAEWYAIMQLNYFTNSIKINDRFIFGPLDSEVRENNSAYKVKAVIKSTSMSTFAVDNNKAIEDTPLIVLALDKDAINPQDNFKTRIANNAPVYLIPSQSSTHVEKDVKVDDTDKKDKSDINDKDDSTKVVNNYKIEDVMSIYDKIPLGSKQLYTPKLLINDVEVDNAVFDLKYSLSGKEQSEWSKYFNIKINDDNSFVVSNLKNCRTGKLNIVLTYNIPNSENESISKEYLITLGNT